MSSSMRRAFVDRARELANAAQRAGTGPPAHAALEGSDADLDLLRRAFREYAALFRSGIIGITSGEEDVVLEANDAFLRIVGYTRENLEAGGLSWVDMTPPEYLEQDVRELERMLQRGYAGPIEKEFVRKDGSRVPVLVGGSTLEVAPFRWLSFVLDLSDLRAAEARYRGLFESAADAILVADADSRYLDANDEACRLLGYAREELLGLRVPDVVAGEPQWTEEEYRRFVSEGRWRGEIALRRRDGSIVPVEAVATKVELPTGTIYLSTLRNVEDRKRAEEERERLLRRERSARAAARRAVDQLQRLSSIVDVSLGYLPLDRFLRELLGRIKDGLAVDAATLFLTTPAGDELVARASVGLEEEARAGIRVPVGMGFVGRIASTGGPQVAEDASRVELASPMARGRVASVAGVPLTLEGRAIGVFRVATWRRRAFSDDDMGLLELVAARIASAIQRANIQDERDRMGRALQESLLPRRLPEIPGVEVAVRYLAASQGNQVGGDFYDVFELRGGRWAIAIGDVCGKGAAAASTMGIARHSLRALGRQQSRPSSILSALNDLLIREDDATTMFVTACLVRLEPTDVGVRATLAAGGHPLPLRRFPDGRVETVGKPGTLLGIFPVELSDIVVDLAPGDTLVLYTDGIVDDREGGFPSLDQVRALLAESGGLGPQEVADRIGRLAEPKTDDDKAWIVLRVGAPPATVEGSVPPPAR